MPHTAQPSPTEIDKMLDDLDPSTLRDATHFRAIIAANDVVTAGQRSLVQAVIAARVAGDSWDIIGAALGVSRQAVEQRFGKAVRLARGKAA